jgi:predicted Zn-dependent peptidase
VSSFLVALTVALQAVPAPAPQEDRAGTTDPFRPDTVLAAPNSPRVVLVSSVDGGVAALRLSVPLAEGPVEAGAGQILRELALDRMEGLAGTVGARVDAARTPWGLVYTVEGASADLEYLAYVLRGAVSEPTEDDVDIEAHRLRLAQRVARSEETPGGRIVDDLRRQVAPDLPPLLGTSATVAQLDAARLRNVWRRSHRPEAMRLVVAAPVVPEVVLAAVQGMGSAAPEQPPLDAPPPPEGSRSPAQSLRTWHGEAWSAGSPADPRATVAAILLADHLALQADGFEAGVHLEALQDRWLLVVAGAAYPQNLRRMRQAVSGSLRTTRDALTPDWVDEAVHRARRDILFAARTPSGLVARIGRDMEVTGSHDAATDYLQALSALTLQDMARYMDGLLAAGAFAAEVRP